MLGQSCGVSLPLRGCSYNSGRISAGDGEKVRARRIDTGWVVRMRDLALFFEDSLAALHGWSSMGHVAAYSSYSKDQLSEKFPEICIERLLGGCSCDCEAD
jgi:hypothetical protein